MILYAVQIKMDDYWMYLTEGSDDNPTVKTFRSGDTAEEVAEYFRLTGKEHHVRVVVYKVDDNDRR